MTSARIVVFGDPNGVPQIRRALGDAAHVAAIVQASIRPAQNAEMAALASAMQVPLIVQPSAKSPDHQGFVRQLHELRPDFILVNSYSMILQPEVLSAAKKLAANIHGGLLPQYRGANVTEWAIINEESESGVTAHVMDEGLDTGSILARKNVPLRFVDTRLDARARINEATEQLLAELLPRLIADDVQPKPQGEGRHWRRRKPVDGAFTWSWPLRRIYNLIRALVAPHPGAWAETAPDRPFAEWISLPELASLKYDSVGPWQAEGIRLKPAQAGFEQDRERANFRFRFEFASGEGQNLGITELFPEYGSNRVQVKMDSTAQRPAAAVIRSFCETELAISDVSFAS